MKKIVFLFVVFSAVAALATNIHAQQLQLNPLNNANGVLNPDRYPLIDGTALDWLGNPQTFTRAPSCDPGILLPAMKFDCDPGILLSPKYIDCDPGMIFDPGKKFIPREMLLEPNTAPSLDINPLMNPFVTPFFEPGGDLFQKEQELQDAGRLTLPDMYGTDTTNSK